MNYYAKMKEKQDFFTIIGERVKFYQSKYNPTSDAVWLAAFAGRAKNVLDVGAGTGGVSLSYLYYNNDANITAVEISDDMIDALNKNTKLNNANINIVHSDIFKWKTDDTFDLVLTNPPYFKGTNAKHNAHHNTDLTKWIKLCMKRVKPRGNICIIADALCTSEIISALSPTFGAIKILPLFSKNNTAERVLIGARLGVKTGTTIFSGINMNDERVLRQGLTIDNDLYIVNTL